METRKNIIITGANGGIGRATVMRFAEEGYDIWACARQKDDEFELWLNTVASGNNVKIFPCYFELANSEQLRKKVKEIIKTANTIDVLVNCAGVAHGGLFQMTSIETIKKIFEINFFSMLELTQLLLRPMIRQKHGCIINMASVSGLDSRAGNSAYGASKAAVITWTKTLASEVGPLGIRVNAIAPGLTDTRMAAQMESKASKEMISDVVINRLIKPEEIANIAAFLASDQASVIIGQVIRADGGSKK